MEYGVFFRLVSLLIISFEEVQCSGTIAVRLDQYSNPRSIVADGKGTCCDAYVFCSSSNCDPFFRLCYTHIGSKSYCDILKKQTTTYDDAATIAFGKMIGGMQNPTTSRFTSTQKVGMSIQITVVDHDTTGEDIIEKLKYEHLFQHDVMITPSKYKKNILMNGRACRVQLTVFVECDLGWYGHQCDKTCQEFRMSSDPDMYGCDHRGYIALCRHNKTICQETKTTNRPFEVIRAASPSTTTLHSSLTTSPPQTTTQAYVHATQSQRFSTERTPSDRNRLTHSTERTTRQQTNFNSNNINLGTRSSVSNNNTGSTTSTSSNDSPSLPTDDTATDSTTVLSLKDFTLVTTDAVMENNSLVSNGAEIPCLPLKDLLLDRNSLLLTFGVVHNVTLPNNKINLTWALESWKRKSSVNNFTASIAEISGSYFSLVITVPVGVSVSASLDDVFHKGSLQKRIEKTIGHSIFPANRSFCSPSLIKQVQWPRSEGAGDRSSSIVGAVMGVLFLLVSMTAIGLVYHWYRKHKRKVLPEKSSVELQLVEENLRD